MVFRAAGTWLTEGERWSANAAYKRASKSNTLAMAAPARRPTPPQAGPGLVLEQLRFDISLSDEGEHGLVTVM
jgi:hypothetical protein